MLSRLGSPTPFQACLGLALALGVVSLWSCDSCDDDDCEIRARTDFRDTSNQNGNHGGTIIIIRTLTLGARLVSKTAGQPATTASGSLAGAPARVHLLHGSTLAVVERDAGILLHDAAGIRRWAPGAQLNYLADGSAVLTHTDGHRERLSRQPLPPAPRYHVDTRRQLVHVLDLDGEPLVSIPEIFVTFHDNDSEGNDGHVNDDNNDDNDDNDDNDVRSNLLLTADLPHGEGPGGGAAQLIVLRDNPHVLCLELMR